MFQAYLITCLINGRAYVGITSRRLVCRWAEHLYDGRSCSKGMAISRAIAKHGKDNFRFDAICSARSWEDICATEAVLIAQWETRAPNGYNLSAGGEGPFGAKRSAESVERSAAKHRGKPCHPNTRLAASQFHIGRKKSAEHRARIAAARTGKPRTEATKAKLAAYWAVRRAAGAFKTSSPYAHGASLPAP